jgi:hypothetical protein
LPDVTDPRCPAPRAIETAFDHGSPLLRNTSGRSESHRTISPGKARIIPVHSLDQRGKVSAKSDRSQSLHHTTGDGLYFRDGIYDLNGDGDLEIVVTVNDEGWGTRNTLVFEL